MQDGLDKAGNPWSVLPSLIAWDLLLLLMPCHDIEKTNHCLLGKTWYFVFP